MPLVILTALLLDVGFIRSAGDFDGPGCSLWLATDRSRPDARRVFVSDIDNRATMHIDGHDLSLTMVKAIEPKFPLRIGTRSSYTYRAGETTATVDYVATEVCRPNDESCEVTGYRAIITIKSGKQVRSVRARGHCGS